MKTIFWSPDLPAPEILRSCGTLVVLDSCALFLLFYPERAGHIPEEKRKAMGEGLAKILKRKGRTCAVVFDFIIHEAETEEQRIFGKKTMRKRLKDLNVFFVRTGVRGLKRAAETIDLVSKKHSLLKRFEELHPIDSALIVCIRRLSEEGIKVYVATTDSPMTDHLWTFGIPNFFRTLGIF